MPATGPRISIVTAALVICASSFAAHVHEERQAYKTGVYIGTSAFTAANYQNGVCAGVAQRGCAVRDLSRDSVMEDALASAHIIPSLADSVPLHTGFRDGWRQARAGAFSGR
jgi:hypothetical protein